jgi:Fe-S cluster assembly protein SufD
MSPVAEGISLKNFAADPTTGATLGNGAGWAHDLVRAGQERFAAVGFPRPKDEEWRFTNFNPIARTAFAPAEPADVTPDDAARFGMRDESAVELVFVNGFFTPRLSQMLSLPRGAKVGTMAGALESNVPALELHLGRHATVERTPFAALNSARLRDGAFVFLPRGTALELPIHVMFLTTPGAGPTVTHPRVLVVAEENVEATVVETYAGLGEGVYFTNAVTEIVAAQDSRIDHCRLQHESQQAYHVSAMQVTLGKAATFVSHAASLGARLSRNDLGCAMNGDGADATLNGLVILSGGQHCDNHTTLDHARPNCPSHELYKHVLDGKSSAVFKGKILVRQPAQKTDSKQTSKSLLLSDDATMNSQPSLEIYADDVKCTHGSTTGPVDDDMVFYLRTRGVSLAAARDLLTYAFAADVTRRIRVAPVRRYLENYIAAARGLPLDLRITDQGSHDLKAL